ncbi:MAG TPA: phosphoribosyltransferase family protein [Candidatus Paceibacterota bacterium]
MVALKTVLHRFARGFIDLLLPQAAEVRFLEDASVASLLQKARPASKELPGIISVFDYRDPLIKRMVWEIKFRGNRRLAKLAADVLYEHLLAELSELKLFSGGSQVLLVPVPLAAKRMRGRGFNQAERIADEMIKIDGGKNFSISTSVVRVKETKSQTQTKSRSERMQNMNGAFSVINKKSVMGKNIIVLDDVVTTGSTIGEIKKVLLQSGAASVIGLTLAH